MASLASSSSNKKKDKSPFRKDLDKEARLKSAAVARQHQEEEEEEEEDEEEMDTQISTLSRTMSASSSRSNLTTSEQVMSAIRNDPELLKSLIAENTDEVADLVELTRKEKEANRMMELSAEEFKEDYQEDIQVQLIKMFGKYIEAFIKSDPKRKRFLNKADTHRVALSKFIELNDFSEKFGKVFQDAFDDVYSDFKDDFMDAFVGQYLGEIEEDEDEDNDESSDYEEGTGKKRRSKGGYDSPGKKTRAGPGATLSPSSSNLKYGTLVETYVPNFDEWRTAEISNKTQGGYVSMSKAKTLLAAGMLRFIE